MDSSKQFDQDDQGLVDSGSASSPIVIVQRGRPTWGREILLLFLLIATAGYIFYQEYRGPAIIVRSESPSPSRVVDAVPVPPINSGAGLLRNAQSAPVDEEPFALSDTDSTEGQDQDDTHPATGPELVSRVGDESDTSQDEPVPSDEAIAFAGDDHSSTVEDFAVDEPVAEEIHSNDGAQEPRRSTHEIVWDLERKDRPSIEPVPPHALNPPGASEVRGETDLIQRQEREPAPQTLAERRYFQQCLALALRQYGRDAGPHIQGLCRDFRIPLPSEVMNLEQRYGSNLFLQGADIEHTVTALRSMGAPESYLLEQLYEQMTKTIGVRRGPRDPMEARVYAARKLLAIPLSTPNVGEGPITQ